MALWLNKKRCFDMKIKYRTDPTGIAMRTKCPFGMKTENGYIIHVASGACAMCEHYGGESQIKKFVVCNNDYNKR